MTQIAPSDAVEAADPQSGPSAAAPGPGSGLGDPDLKLMLRGVSHRLRAADRDVGLEPFVRAFLVGAHQA